MSKFKVGDKVRVVTKGTIEQWEGVGYDSLHVDPYVGREFTVKRVGVSHRGGKPMTFLDSPPSDFWWPDCCLELVVDVEAERKVQEEADAIIRDALRYREIRRSDSRGSVDIVAYRKDWRSEDNTELLTGAALDRAVDEFLGT